ncbi:hypothetical protein Glove_363g42 [Diversispora epigaea]|uniref:MULE transposase domain-containing protein n=1 Tax=Diversispora epigaea TaxID=1348612 RepID=A0A397H8Z6_9GLOM|nr:hypothetical protein Glove_363g42 [Diversispora epigaea]
MNDLSLSKQSPLPLNNMNEINIIKLFLYEGKIFNIWQQTFEIIEGWTKQQEFKIKYSRVEKNPDGIFRKRTIQCEHQGKYVSKSNNKQTTTKRIGCLWHVNLSEPQSENLLKHIYITIFHNIYSHALNPNVIQFGSNKNLSSEILKEIEFLTIQCKLGTTFQRQYLEARFPGQIIYNEDLYYAIQSFRLQNKNNSNDTAKLYTKLLENLQNNSIWKVAIKFDDNNTLTHMTPSQLELWYQFSDIVVQDVTCKTNRYDMALKSHEWMFNQINLATDNLHPRVIMTDVDPAVHATIRSTFLTTYPMHCTFHIAHPWTCRQFTAGLHASSPVENKNYQLILWKAAIPCVSTQITVPAFINEIRQCIFYDAVQINQKEIYEFNENNFSDQHLEDIPDARQTTASCMISDVNKKQIIFMWAITVENNLIEKHFIILLSNGSYHCSCLLLINRGFVYRHYFQIILRSSTAKFHLRLIPSRWYYKGKDPSKELFLVATKFENEITSIIPESNIPFLTAVNVDPLYICVLNCKFNLSFNLLSFTLKAIFGAKIFVGYYVLSQEIKPFSDKSELEALI